VTPRTKALFLGFPCNPTGAVLPPAVQDELAAIAVRHDLLVYSDEIYDRLAYGDYRHRAMSALPGMRERTILMGGFSKAYAMTGWRVGYVCAPAAILEGIVKVHQYGIMSAPTTAQDAALVAITSADADVEALTPDKGPPGAVGDGTQGRAVFGAGLETCGCRSGADFAVDFMLVDVGQELVEQTVSAFEFQDAVGRQEGRQAFLPVVMAAFDFALGLRGGGEAQGDAVEVECGAQLGESVGVMGVEEGVVVDIEGQGQAVGLEGAG
jgi:histidinol-phosphate/aromatic aminotransferase/cobyric acid decarboxylase-like protein